MILDWYSSSKNEIGSKKQRERKKKNTERRRRSKLVKASSKIKENEALGWGPYVLSKIDPRFVAYCIREVIVVRSFGRDFFVDNVGLPSHEPRAKSFGVS